VASSALESLAERLAADGVDAALAALAAPADLAPSTLAPERAWIDAAYAGDHAETIRDRLADRPEPAAVKAAEALGKASPTSVKVTLRALREARDLATLEECLAQEHRISMAFLDEPDFVEGVRAAVVDKDRSPRWRPATLDEVDDAALDRFFDERGTA
jgi:enoyl-CoA hydratase